MLNSDSVDDLLGDDYSWIKGIGAMINFATDGEIGYMYLTFDQNGTLTVTYPMPDGTSTIQTFSYTLSSDGMTAYSDDSSFELRSGGYLYNSTLKMNFYKT